MQFIVCGHDPFNHNACEAGQSFSASIENLARDFIALRSALNYKWR